VGQLREMAPVCQNFANISGHGAMDSPGAALNKQVIETHTSALLKSRDFFYEFTNFYTSDIMREQ
jgi:hypothetical protein